MREIDGGDQQKTDAQPQHALVALPVQRPGQGENHGRDRHGGEFKKNVQGQKMLRGQKEIVGRQPETGEQKQGEQADPHFQPGHGAFFDHVFSCSVFVLFSRSGATAMPPACAGIRAVSCPDAAAHACPA
ncbi:hypothetical protein [Azohydromonas caseinilytica]|uniref:hypothetical protein n=1 Tax=Azohydromonas caseinilytica TaxID=2728836 RepID=UPI001F2CCCA2|nr:hypothetical protein [Azohydromonas caseinilytica]